MSQKFTYNGKEKSFDLALVSDSKRFEAAVRGMQDEESNLPKTGYASDIMQAQVNMLKKFFDTVFEAGAGNEICGEEDNLNSCYDAYEAFLGYVKEQKESMLRRRTFAANKLSGKKKH